MKEILIISYHALPMDVVSSYRTKAYCDYLHLSDMKPTLLTHRWEYDLEGNWKFHEPNEQIVEETYDTYQVIRLPRPKTFKPKNQYFSKISTVKSWFNGNLDIELINSYKIYKNFLFDHLQTHTYDLIISIFSPHFHLKLAYEVNHKFGIPYVLDFRDLWSNNRIAKAAYIPSVREKTEDLIISYWWKKWLSNSLFFSITSNHWCQILEKLTRKKGVVVRNGIEEFHTSKSQTEEFKVIYFGAIYPEQDLEPMFEGINLFISKEKSEKIKIEFIGIKERYRPGVISEIKKNIPNEHLRIIPSLSKNELLQYCQSVSLFIYPAFSNIEGWFSAKLYDYIALGKETMIIPSTSKEVNTIISKSNVGVILETPEDLVDHLSLRYNEFLQNGETSFNIDLRKLNEFTRRYQVNIMANAIKGSCL